MATISMAQSTPDNVTVVGPPRQRVPLGQMVLYLVLGIAGAVAGAGGAATGGAAAAPFCSALRASDGEGRSAR